MYNIDDEEAFFKLFRSNTEAYGTTIVGDIVNGKAESKSQLIHSPLTSSVLTNHLNGVRSIGLSPLLPNGTVNWCAIDIDDNSYNIKTAVRAIYDFNIPIVPVYSKSKHLHLYVFFNEETPAVDAIELCRSYFTVFRLEDKTEIFPKQSRITSATRFPSWINIPYFDANNMDNHRKAISEDMQLLDLHSFTMQAQEKQVSLEEHINILKGLPYYGAPPCIFSGAILRDIAPGGRNQWLYNVACYLRMDDEDADITEPLLELNETLDEPLPEREIMTTVSKVATHTYFYQCSGMAGCNKKVCKKSESGIGSNKSTKFNFGDLVKINTDPVQWEWEINGKILRFASTEQFLNQRVFQRLCVDKINQCPFIVQAEKWTQIVRRALDNVTERNVDIKNDIGSGAAITQAILNYFASGRLTVDRSEIGKGYIYKDEEAKKYCFDVRGLTSFVMATIKGNRIKEEEIRPRAIDLGMEVDDGYWSIPIDRVEIIHQSRDVDYSRENVQFDGGDEGVI